MALKIGIPAFVLTSVLDIAAIYFVYTMWMLNTNFGEHNETIRFLGTGIIVVAIVMTLGCFAAQMGFTQEGLEAMAPKQ